GWASESKEAGHQNLAELVATGNYAGLSVDYRLLGEAPWPAQIHDCKAAIRWVRAQGNKYRLDAQHVGVWGTSAGAHLVDLLGVSGDVAALEGDSGNAGHSSRVQCVVDFAAPKNFLAIGEAGRSLRQANKEI